jgi:hypothetical protein
MLFSILNPVLKDIPTTPITHPGEEGAYPKIVSSNVRITRDVMVKTVGFGSWNTQPVNHTGGSDPQSLLLTLN